MQARALTTEALEDAAHEAATSSADHAPQHAESSHNGASYSQRTSRDQRSWKPQGPEQAGASTQVLILGLQSNARKMGILLGGRNMNPAEVMAQHAYNKISLTFLIIRRN